jgi:hypothetical protein
LSDEFLPSRPPVKAHKPVTVCGDVSPRGGLICVRPPGHDGDHASLWADDEGMRAQHGVVDGEDDCQVCSPGCTGIRCNNCTKCHHPDGTL